MASYYKSDFISATQAIQKIVDENNFLLCETKMGGDGSDDVLFKARVAEPTENIKHEDMLHIPFDCRNIVASQRFSLSGTPCIYLSRSSYPIPIFCDSPSGREVEKSTIDGMLNILKRDYSHHQLVLASIYKYSEIFPNAKIIETNGTLFNKQTLFD